MSTSTDFWKKKAGPRFWFEWGAGPFAFVLSVVAMLLFMMNTIADRVDTLIKEQNTAALKLADSLHYFAAHRAPTDESIPPGLFSDLVEFSRNTATIRDEVHRLPARGYFGKEGETSRRTARRQNSITPASTPAPPGVRSRKWAPIRSSSISHCGIFRRRGARPTRTSVARSPSICSRCSTPCSAPACATCGAARAARPARQHRSAVPLHDRDHRRRHDRLLQLADPDQPVHANAPGRLPARLFRQYFHRLARRYNSQAALRLGPRSDNAPEDVATGSDGGDFEAGGRAAGRSRGGGAGGRERANTWHLDLRGAILKQADLGRASRRRLARGCPSRETHLDGAHLEDANLLNTHFERAALSGVYLAGATLRGAQLQDADLSYSHLQDADLGPVRFEGANFSRSALVAQAHGGVHGPHTVRRRWRRQLQATGPSAS